MVLGTPSSRPAQTCAEPSGAWLSAKPNQQAAHSHPPTCAQPVRRSSSRLCRSCTVSDRLELSGEGAEDPLLRRGSQFEGMKQCWAASWSCTKRRMRRLITGLQMAALHPSHFLASGRRATHVPPCCAAPHTHTCPAALPDSPTHPVTESQPSSTRLRRAGNAPCWPRPLPITAAQPHSNRAATAECRWPTSRSVSSDTVGTPDRVMVVSALRAAGWGRRAGRGWVSSSNTRQSGAEGNHSS